MMRVGIIGSGVISRTYLSDIQHFYRNIEVTACADIDQARAQALADEFHIPKACVTEELLADPDIDIVVNLTPPQLHTAIARQVLESGKHLFSEKPFAPGAVQAAELVKLAEEKGLYIGGAPDTFLASGLQTMRHYLDTGIIGNPFFVTMNMTTFGVETWHPNPLPFYKKGAGPIYDMAPYYLSALTALLGPMEQIAAFSTAADTERKIYVGPHAGETIQSEVPTHYTSIIRMRSGVVVNFNISFDIYRSGLPMFEIYGDGGTLTYPDPNFGGGNPRIYRKEQYIDPIYNLSDDARERKERFYELPELFQRYKDYSRGIGVSEMADAIQNGAKNRTGGDFLIHVTEGLEGLIQAAEKGIFYQMQTSCERPAVMQ